MIIINSAKAAQELLERRMHSSRVFSDVYDLMGFGKAIAFLPYGKTLHMHRKMYNEYLSREKCLGYRQLQFEEAQRLVDNIKQSPESFEDHLFVYATGTITRLAYGHVILTHDDKYLRIVRDVGNCMLQCPPPGSNLVDLIPIMKYMPSWFPGTYPATLARSFQPIVQRIFEYPVEDINDQLDKGIAQKSFLSTHLQGFREQGESYEYPIQEVKEAAPAFYVAGVDTTFATSMIFILAMVLYPSVQAAAQEEIDRVLGEDAIPTFDDRASLLYVEHLVQEVYRWHNAAPTGIPHVSTEDDVYEGMFIPKGSILIGNIRGITLDEDVYSNPHTFDPSRYARGEPYSSSHFGYGRRICSGRYFADASVWICVATILANFTISPIIGSDGKPVIPKEEFNTGLGNHPKQFSCRILPRKRK
ncbi:cytochrome P450 [Agrocybe pediades]|nr:cytochrome P450 [Agrocybe pediades]